MTKTPTLFAALKAVGITAKITIVAGDQSTDGAITATFTDSEGCKRAYALQIGHKYVGANCYTFNPFGDLEGVVTLHTGTRAKALSVLVKHAQAPCAYKPDAITRTSAIKAIRDRGMIATYDASTGKYRVTRTLAFYKNYFKLTQRQAVARQEREARYAASPRAAHAAAKAISEAFHVSLNRAA